MTQSDHKADVEIAAQLAEIMTGASLTRIEFEKDGLKLNLRREAKVQAAPLASAPVVQDVSAAQLSAPSAAIAAKAPTSSPEAAQGTMVKSPMVGTVYLSPAPDKPPFINLGDKVPAGIALLTIEAMKTFNEVFAPVAGQVVEILVEDGEPVEYGQPLVRIA